MVPTLHESSQNHPVNIFLASPSVVTAAVSPTPDDPLPVVVTALPEVART